MPMGIFLDLHVGCTRRCERSWAALCSYDILNLGLVVGLLLKVIKLILMMFLLLSYFSLKAFQIIIQLLLFSFQEFGPSSRMIWDILYFNHELLQKLNFIGKFFLIIGAFMKLIFKRFDLDFVCILFLFFLN